MGKDKSSNALWGIPDFKIGETRTPEFGASKNVLL